MGQEGSQENSAQNYRQTNRKTAIRGPIEGIEEDIDFSFDFESSSDEDEELLENLDVKNENDPEVLRSMIMEQKSEKKALKKKYREKINELKFRNIELERDIRKMNRSMNKFSKEKIKRLEEEKLKLEQKFGNSSSSSSSTQQQLPRGGGNRRGGGKSMFLTVPQNQRISRIVNEINQTKMQRIESYRFRSKRGNVVKEFFFTEKDYVDCLKLLKTEYLSQLSQGKIVSKKKYSKITIFEDFDTIFNVNSSFLSRLEETVFLQERDEALVDLVLEFCSSFELYSDYIKHFSTSQNVINELMSKNKKFVKFLNETSHDLRTKNISLDGGGGTKDFSLLGLLINPIQRLPRYLLFLKDLHKFTRTSSPQYTKLEEVVRRLERTIQFCDESTKTYEQSLKLVELSKTLNISLIQKELILDTKQIGRVNSAGKYRNCFLYLFNDLFVIRQVKSNSGSNSPLQGSLRERKGSKLGRLGGVKKMIVADKKQWNIYFLEEDTTVHGCLKSIRFSNYVTTTAAEKGNEEEEEEKVTKLILILEVRGYRDELKIIIQNKKDLDEIIKKINEQRKIHSFPVFKLRRAIQL